MTTIKEELQKEIQSKEWALEDACQMFATEVEEFSKECQNFSDKPGWYIVETMNTYAMKLAKTHAICERNQHALTMLRRLAKADDVVE